MQESHGDEPNARVREPNAWERKTTPRGTRTHGRQQRGRLKA